MVKVSIISLVYQSPALADWVYDSAHKFTPMIARGEAEFFFVANDPTSAIIAHLTERDYPHVVNINKRYSDESLFALGYGTPEYMSRVYRGYNEGIRQAKGDYVVLVNSDNYFSPDWLENLLKYSDRSRVIVSRLVERSHPVFSVFPGAVHGEFGDSPATFDEAAFLSFAADIRKTGLEAGGAYMPALFHRDIAIEAGLYPCGNVAGEHFANIVRYGDEAFFDVLRSMGVQHFTALDSIAYHLKEGERDNCPHEQAPSAKSAEASEVGATPVVPFPTRQALPRVLDSMSPTKRHDELMMRISSGRDSHARARQAAALAAETAAGVRLVEQSERFRRAVERVVGVRFASRVMRVVHAVSWTILPLRLRLARRKVRGWHGTSATLGSRGPGCGARTGTTRRSLLTPCERARYDPA